MPKKPVQPGVKEVAVNFRIPEDLDERLTAVETEMWPYDRNKRSELMRKIVREFLDRFDASKKK